MTIYKNKDIATDIRVTGVELGNIGAKFYTEDENTGSISIYIKHNGNFLDLSATNLKPKLDLFSSDGSVFLDQPLEITNATGGLVTYKVTKEVVKHVGTITAKLFLVTDDDSESVHVATFQFDIGDSGVDKAISKSIDIDIISDKITEVITANANLFRGEPFTFEDFTQEQLDSLKVKGDKGDKGDGLKIDGYVASENLLPSGTSATTYIVGTKLYIRSEGSSTWTPTVDLYSRLSITSDGYWAIDGVKSTVIADANVLFKQIELGNRNYILNSLNVKANANGVGLGTSIQNSDKSWTATPDLGKGVSVYIPFSPSILSIPSLDLNKKYVASIEIMVDKPSKVTVYMNNVNSQVGVTKTLTENVYTRFPIQFTAKAGVNPNLIFIAETVDTKVTYTRLKLEIGTTIATDWTPAHEDFYTDFIKSSDGQTYKTFLDTGESLVLNSIDFNNPDASLTKSGFYLCGASTNQPTGETTIGFVNFYKRNTQAYITYKGYTSNNLYMKSKVNGTWGAWKNLTGDTPTWTTATLSNGFTGTVKYYKDPNNLVTVQFDVTAGSTISFGTLIALLPNSHLPIDYMMSVPSVNISSGVSGFFTHISNNGTTKGFCVGSTAMTSGQRYAGQITYRVG